MSENLRIVIPSSSNDRGLSPVDSQSAPLTPRSSTGLDSPTDSNSPARASRARNRILRENRQKSSSFDIDVQDDPASFGLLNTSCTPSRVPDDWEKSLSSSFVPNILRKLIKLAWKEDAPTQTLIPTSLFVKGFCLLVDISGFTKLSARYCEAGKDGIDDLQQATNGFMADIVDIVYLYGGDIIKYAGDAIICIFPAELSCDAARVSRQALSCAFQLKSMVSPDGLTVHVGLSAGDICCAMMGGSHDRWECLVSGSCLMELSQCLDDAPSGNAALSSSVVAFIGQEIVDEFVDVDILPSGNSLLRAIKRVDLQKMEDIQSRISTPTAAEIAKPFDGALPTPTESERDITFFDSSKHPDQIHRLLLKFCPFPVLSGLRNAEMDNVAEIRKLSVVFLRFDSYDAQLHRDLLSLQMMLRTCQDVIHEAGGFIRQFIVDDKGCVLIACWGVPTASFIDNSARALSSSVNIHKALNKLGMECSFGITTGWTYCGCVGSERRREYAAIGDIVNLAARLMCKAKGGIVVDQATHDAIPDMSLQLSALEPMKVKGKDEPIQAYSYQTDAVSSEKLIGRVELMAKMILSVEDALAVDNVIASLINDENATAPHPQSNAVSGPFSFAKYDNIKTYGTPIEYLRFMLIKGPDSANRLLLDYVRSASMHNEAITPVRVCLQERDVCFNMKLFSRLFLVMLPDMMEEVDKGDSEKTIVRIISDAFGANAKMVSFCTFVILDIFGLTFETNVELSEADNIDAVSPKKLWSCLHKLFAHMLKARRWLVSIENIDMADPLSLFYLYTLKDVRCLSLFILSSATSNVDIVMTAVSAAAAAVAAEDTNRLLGTGSSKMDIISGSERRKSSRPWQSWYNAYVFFNELNDSRNTVLRLLSSSVDESVSAAESSLSLRSINDVNSLSGSVQQGTVAVLSQDYKQKWENKFASAFATLPCVASFHMATMVEDSIRQVVITQFPNSTSEIQQLMTDTALQITNGDPYWMAELMTFVHSRGLVRFLDTIRDVEGSSHWNKSNSPTPKASAGHGKASSLHRRAMQRRSVTLNSFKTREISDSAQDNSVLENFVMCRYEALNFDARLVVRLISIVGHRFNLNVCQQIMPPRLLVQFRDIVSELVENRWIVEMTPSDVSANSINENASVLGGLSTLVGSIGSGRQQRSASTEVTDWYRFQHPLFQQVLFNFTPVGERMDFHSKIAEILMNENEESFEHYADIFQHLKSAERRSEAVEYAVLAGNLALDRDFAEIGVDYCIELVKKSMKLCTKASEVDELVGLVSLALVVLPSVATITPQTNIAAIEWKDDTEDSCYLPLASTLSHNGSAVLRDQCYNATKEVDTRGPTQVVTPTHHSTLEKSAAVGTSSITSDVAVVKSTRPRWWSLFACCGSRVVEAVLEVSNHAPSLDPRNNKVSPKNFDNNRSTNNGNDLDEENAPSLPRSVASAASNSSASSSMLNSNNSTSANKRKRRRPLCHSFHANVHEAMKSEYDTLLSELRKLKKTIQANQSLEDERAFVSGGATPAAAVNVTLSAGAAATATASSSSSTTTSMTDQNNQSRERAFKEDAITPTSVTFEPPVNTLTEAEKTEVSP